MKSILFTGAGSGIGRALARLYAEEGYSLYLGARRPEELEDFAADLRIRSGADVKAVKLDMLDYASHASLYEDIGADLCGVVCCAGYMEEQEKAQSDFEIAEKIINTNYTGCVSLLNITADDLERKGGGFIIGISSVAGDRGRKSN
jgi:short-subunit dehydrogenase